MTKTARILFSLGLAALFFSEAGCSRFPGTVEGPKPLADEEWIATLENRGKYWQTYTASLHLRADSAKGKYPLRAVILANLPHQFRLEAFNLWGQTLGVLIYNNEQSSLWVPNEKTLYTARKPGVLTQYFLGISLPLDILGYSLAACLPPEELKTFKLLSERSQWVGKSHGVENSWRYEWSFLSQPMTLKAFEASQGSWHYSVSYEPPVLLEETASPRKIEFLSSEWQMDVTIDQIQTSPNLRNDLFQAVFPGTTRSVSLDGHQ